MYIYHPADSEFAPAELGSTRDRYNQTCIEFV